MTVDKRPVGYGQFGKRVQVWLGVAQFSSYSFSPPLTKATQFGLLLTFMLIFQQCIRVHFWNVCFILLIIFVLSERSQQCGVTFSISDNLSLIRAMGLLGLSNLGNIREISVGFLGLLNSKYSK